MNTETPETPGDFNVPEMHKIAESVSVEADTGTVPALLRGRPTRRVPGVVADILDCLELGMPIVQTCHACGVSERLFRIWRSEDSEFAERVRAAQARAMKKHLAIIQQAALKNWQASAWWLERTYPALWGRSGSLTLEARRGVTREHNEGLAVPDELQAKFPALCGFEKAAAATPDNKPAR